MTSNACQAVFASLIQFTAEISPQRVWVNQFGHGGFGGHVQTLDHALIQGFLACLVQGKIAALVQTLGADHHRHTGLGGLLQFGDQVPADEVQTACTEGLDDHATVVHGQKHVKNLGVQTGGQLDQENPFAQAVLQAAGACYLGQSARIQHQSAAPHGAHKGPVDALEGVEAGGAGFDGAAAQNDLAVKGHEDAPYAGSRHGEGGAQVLQTVGQGMLDGQLASGQHDRQIDAGQHKGQHRRGVGHGIGSVGDDDAVVGLPRLEHAAGDDPPLLGLNVGGVQMQNVPHGDVIGVFQVGQPVGQFLAGNAGSQTLVGLFGGDGAAGGQKKDSFFHI